MFQLTRLREARPEQINFNYVHKGYSSPAEGYWLDVPTGRNLLHMIRTYREQSEYWEKAHGALSEEFKSYIDKTNERLTGIESSIVSTNAPA